MLGWGESNSHVVVVMLGWSWGVVPRGCAVCCYALCCAVLSCACCGVWAVRVLAPAFARLCVCVFVVFVCLRACVFVWGWRAYLACLGVCVCVIVFVCVRVYKASFEYHSKSHYTKIGHKKLPPKRTPILPRTPNSI